MSVWRSRLEWIALGLVVARALWLIGDVADASADPRWTSLGDWFERLDMSTLLTVALLGLALLLVVVTRVLYTWPPNTPYRVALLSVFGVYVLAAISVVVGAGNVVAQFARSFRAEQLPEYAPELVGSGFAALGGGLAMIVLSLAALGLVRDLMPPRTTEHIEPITAPPPAEGTE